MATIRLALIPAKGRNKARNSLIKRGFILMFPFFFVVDKAAGRNQN